MIQLQGIAKRYDLGDTEVPALSGIDLRIDRGEFVTVMGPSGSGKSTLLHILGMLDAPTDGTYRLEGHELTSLPDREISRIRNRHFGFVFQSFNLLPEFSALENVALPLIYAGVPEKQRKERAKSLLAGLGLQHRISHYPTMLSGGEQQRVAIARALANEPSVLLADEPTGNLPSDKGQEVIEILMDLNRGGTTVVMVTHDPQLGLLGRRTLYLKDGRIAREEIR